MLTPMALVIDYTKIKPNMTRLEQVNKQIADLEKEQEELISWLRLHEKSLSQELEKLCAGLRGHGTATLLPPPKD